MRLPTGCIWPGRSRRRRYWKSWVNWRQHSYRTAPVVESLFSANEHNSSYSLDSRTCVIANIANMFACRGLHRVKFLQKKSHKN